MEEKHCLRDVVSGTKADTQIRCNQIWAVSMPFTMLGPDKERQIVDTVFEKLYTPYGLRTLEEADPEFKPFYGGEVLKRDLAYHQNGVGVSAWRVLYSVSQGARIQQRRESICKRAAGGNGRRHAGGMRRTAPGNL